jgi:hypothetical protein
VYVVYPESPQPFPNYNGAAVKYVWSPGDLSRWSKPVTVAPASDGDPLTGHLLTHIVAGDPGRLAVFSMHLLPQDGNLSLFWYPEVAETFNGLDADPTFATAVVSDVPGWNGTASALMGVCYPLGQEYPAVVNIALDGFACGRSSDVYGQALDAQCQPTFVWYDGGAAKDKSGTYVVTQTGGPSLCAGPAHPQPAPA